MSLTISGWVAEQVMWWDDGFESNVYVQGIGTTLASHFKMTGAAQIAPGTLAGYVIHVEVYGSENLLTTNQNFATGPSLYGGEDADGELDNFNGINTLQSYWFVKSDHMGKISVGKQSMASDNTAILPDGSGSLVPANYVDFDYGGFFLRNPDGSLSGASWRDVAGCTDCNGLTLNAVRYDSPTYYGFSVSSSWGADDLWDVAARYAGEWSGFKVAAAGAYSQTSSDPNDVFAQAPDTQFFQVGAYAQHIPTGLWVYGAYGTIENDNDGFVNGDAGYVDNDFWYVKAGLRERWHPLGHTVIYGEYQRRNQDARFGSGLDLDGGPDCQDGPPGPTGESVCTAEVDMWGVGIVQEVDAAAMSFWLSYRHLEADINDVVGGNQGTVATDDFQYVKFGALINF